MTKIFCDIADINLIEKFNRKNIVKGFTTNPSLMRKAGAKNYSKYCKNILKITRKPISFEVFADDKKNIINQALKIKNWGKQVYVKIPVTNSKGKFTGKLIRRLSDKGLKLNITAVYTFEQVKKIVKCFSSYGILVKTNFLAIKIQYAVSINITFLAFSAIFVI